MRKVYGREEMKITRATVAENKWCCQVMQTYIEAAYLYVCFSPTEPMVVVNMISVNNTNMEESVLIRFCPFCGERLEVRNDT
jgi:hypothetical protein